MPCHGQPRRRGPGRTSAGSGGGPVSSAGGRGRASATGSGATRAGLPATGRETDSDGGPGRGSSPVGTGPVTTSPASTWRGLAPPPAPRPGPALPGPARSGPALPAPALPAPAVPAALPAAASRPGAAGRGTGTPVRAPPDGRRRSRHGLRAGRGRRSRDGRERPVPASAGGPAAGSGGWAASRSHSRPTSAAGSPRPFRNRATPIGPSCPAPRVFCSISSRVRATKARRSSGLRRPRAATDTRLT